VLRDTLNATVDFAVRSVPKSIGLLVSRASATKRKALENGAARPRRRGDRISCGMSAVGQKLQRLIKLLASAFTPKADTEQRLARVRYGPEADVGAWILECTLMTHEGGLDRQTRVAQCRLSALSATLVDAHSCVRMIADRVGGLP
jgi:hypothetical protein